MDTIHKSRLYDVVVRARCVTIARLASDHFIDNFCFCSLDLSRTIDAFFEMLKMRISSSYMPIICWLSLAQTNICLSVPLYSDATNAAPNGLWSVLEGLDRNATAVG